MSRSFSVTGGGKTTVLLLEGKDWFAFETSPNLASLLQYHPAVCEGGHHPRHEHRAGEGRGKDWKITRYPRPVPERTKSLFRE